MLDPVVKMDRVAHVLSQMGRYGGQKIQHSDYTFILCPYHSEKTPSGRVFHTPSRSPGYFKCYGCGASKSWNELATDIGLEPFIKPNPKKDEYAMTLSSFKERDDKEPEYSLEELPKKKWRSIPSKLLRDLGAKQMVLGYGQPMVWLPVYIGGRLRGYVRSYWKKPKVGPSHMNKSGQWSKKYGLFPFDFALEMMQEQGHKTMAIVEGPRDALRLLQYKIPAVSILGTQSWTPQKALLFETYGVSTVVVIMDGDPAGIEATKKARSFLEGQINRIRSFKLWKVQGNPYPMWKRLPNDEQKARKGELWDPGNCPEYVLDIIRKRFFKGN